MTTPPGLVTASFDGVLTPAQINELLDSLISGAPFAGSLTRAQTSTGRMAFPTVWREWPWSRRRTAIDGSGPPEASVPQAIWSLMSAASRI